ncbi:MAG: DUF1289 domain-containing protein [Paracoccus sp. (in: a-proteobacteria)]|nr:DUF1289 domain-containing protein [Paracoccus sp. (in: a-proteobacteria)]
MTDSPCIQICQIETDHDLCIGCFRTLDEIACWGMLSPQARQAIMATLPERERQMEDGS